MGGVSPLTIDYVNPEAPWPHLADLERRTRSEGFTLVPRLPIYPEYQDISKGFLDPAVAPHVQAAAGADGYAQGGIGHYVARH